jgi:hypothetical protein
MSLPWEMDVQILASVAPQGAVPWSARAGLTTVAAAPTVAGSPDRRLLLAIVARLIAAHRARQAAAVDRALRHGLAAID